MGPIGERPLHDTGLRRFAQLVYGVVAAKKRVSYTDVADDIILELRRTVPREVMAQVLSEFDAAIRSGDLRVQALDRELAHDGVTPIPNDGTPDSLRKRNAFNPVFAAGSLLPKLETTGNDGKTTLLFLRDQVRGEAHYLGVTDPLVERALREKIQAKTQGKVFRDLVKTLLGENRVVPLVDTCSDPAWPCVSRDPVRLAEALFPETLYPGKNYGNWGPNRPISSSLEDSGEYSKVMDISMDSFARVFEISNAGRAR
jgi:hypothetical protein